MKFFTKRFCYNYKKQQLPKTITTSKQTWIATHFVLAMTVWLILEPELVVVDREFIVQMNIGLVADSAVGSG